MPRPRLRLCLLAVLVCAGCTTGGIEQEEWYRYESSHFTIYSPVRESRVAERIHNLEAFRATVHRLLDLEEAESFEHSTSFLLLPLMGHLRALFGVERNIVGFFRPGVRQNLIVAAEPGYRSLFEDNQVVLHEYVHYLVRNASSFRYPPWFDEGFAQVLSATTIDGDVVTVGTPPRSAAYRLVNGTGRMALDELVSMESYTDLLPAKLQEFYGTAWLLTHYLTLSEPAFADGLNKKVRKYLRLYDAGRGGPEAFQDALGMQLGQLRRTLQHYQRNVPIRELPLATVTFDSSYERNKLSAGEIAYELGYMIVSSNPDYARRLFVRVLEQAPHHARAMTGLGVSYQMQEDYQAAEELMRQALALEGNDYLLMTELADLLRIQCEERASGDTCPDDAVSDEMEHLYRSAYELNPHSPETLRNYGRILVRNGEPRRAVPLLQKAYRLLPSSYELLFELSLAYAEAGCLDAARRQLRRAAGWTENDAEEQARVKDLLRQLEAAGAPGEAPLADQVGGRLRNSRED